MSESVSLHVQTSPSEPHNDVDQIFIWLFVHQTYTESVCSFTGADSDRRDRMVDDRIHSLAIINTTPIVYFENKCIPS